MNRLRPTFCLKLWLATTFVWTVTAATALAQSDPAELPGFSYPHPVAEYVFTSQGLPMKMAYMDVKPEKPNGHTIVLLHGKNFCAATWEVTIRVGFAKRLSRHRAGSDRLLQINQAGAVSI
jgi:pimeloyl-ACP methyl ester carboxylesterase